jgi:hypothetical protein
VLTEPRIGGGDHHHLADAGHGEQGLFDLQRADVLAAADDDVGFAVGDGQVTVVVENPDVTGVVPALVIERGGGSSVSGVAKSSCEAAGGR